MPSRCPMWARLYRDFGPVPNQSPASYRDTAGPGRLLPDGDLDPGSVRQVRDAPGNARVKVERLFRRYCSKPDALLRLGHRQQRIWEQDPVGVEPALLVLELLEVSKPEPDLRIARRAALEERFERSIDVLQFTRLCDELYDRFTSQEELVAHAVGRERDVFGKYRVVENAECSLALPHLVKVVPRQPGSRPKNVKTAIDGDESVHRFE